MKLLTLITFAVVMLSLSLFLLFGLLFVGAPISALNGILSTGAVGAVCARMAYSEWRWKRVMGEISRQK